MPTLRPATFYGYPLEELKAKKMTEINTLPLETVRSRMRRACSGEEQHFTFQHRLADGVIREVEIFSGPIIVKGKKLLYSIVHDITERRRLEAEVAMKAQLLDLTTDSIFVLDPEGTFQYVNEAAYKTRGYTREELLKLKLPDLDTPDQTALIPARLQMVREKGEASFESRHRRQDGTEMPVEVSVKQIRLDGRALFLSSVRDITARVQADEALRLSNQRLDLLAATASELLASASPQELINILCHKVATFLDCEVFLNFLAESEAGRLHLNTYSGITAEQARRIEWIDYGAGVCGHVAKGGRRIEAEDIQHSLNPRTNLLKSFGLQAYACQPLLVEGKVLGTLGFGCRRRHRFIEDELTLMQAVADQVAMALERKRAEEALAESERRYRRLVEMSPDAIVVHQNGRFVFINQAGAQLFGAPEPQILLGRQVLELVHPDFLAAVKNRKQQVYAGVPAELSEEKILRLDGQAVDVETTSVPVEYKGQTAVQVILRDITRRKEAEAALRQERDFSAALLNTLGALVVVLDREGRIVRFNQACEVITGYSFAEVEGKFFFDIFLLPEERAAVKEIFQNLCRGNLPNTYENHWLSRTGEKRLISWSNTALTDADGVVTYLIGTGIDITRQRRAEEALRRAHGELERRVASRTDQLRQTVDKLLVEIVEREKAEARLRQSEARFSAFMKHLPGSAIMRDLEGRFLFANEAWELQLGRRPGESLGKTLDDLWPPEIAQKLKELDQQVLLENRPLEAMVELPVHGEKRTFLSHRFPISNIVGEVEMIGTIGIDITDRLKAEEARDRLIEIVEATPDFIGSANLEGQIFYLNRAAREMLGLGAEDDLTALSYGDTMSAWARERVITEGRPVYLKEGSWQGESAIRRSGRQRNSGIPGDPGPSGPGG